MRVAALVDDLMDRSRLSGAITEVQFVSSVDECVGAEAVVVDLARHGSAIAALRAIAPEARIVAFGPHVDTDAAERAADDGADLVLPRSRFFRDPTRVVTG